MNNLKWILEPATRPADEEGQIYETVIEKRPDQLVAIYMGHERTATGYRNVPMVCVKNKGETDFVSKPWSDDFARRFPRAAKWWEANKDRPVTVDLSLLPGISPAEVAELRDLQIADVQALSGAEVPAHLTGWKEMALRLRSLAKPRVRMEAVPC